MTELANRIAAQKTANRDKVQNLVLDIGVLNIVEALAHITGNYERQASEHEEKSREKMWRTVSMALHRAAVKIYAAT